MIGLHVGNDQVSASGAREVVKVCAPIGTPTPLEIRHRVTLDQHSKFGILARAEDHVGLPLAEVIFFETGLQWGQINLRPGRVDIDRQGVGSAPDRFKPVV